MVLQVPLAKVVPAEKWVKEKHNVYRDIVVIFLNTKDIFIDRILTCGVQYIKFNGKKKV